MVTLNTINFEGQEFLRGLSDVEREKFIDHCVTVGMPMQPFPKGVNPKEAISRIVDQEAEKFGAQKVARAKFDEDFRFHQRISSIPSGVSARPQPVESGDPAEALEAMVKRLMSENPSLSYSGALTEAQRQRKDLAEAILQQLEDFRGRNKPDRLRG